MIKNLKILTIFFKLNKALRPYLSPLGRGRYEDGQVRGVPAWATTNIIGASLSLSPSPARRGPRGSAARGASAARRHRPRQIQGSATVCGTKTGGSEHDVPTCSAVPGHWSWSWLRRRIGHRSRAEAGLEGISWRLFTVKFNMIEN